MYKSAGAPLSRMLYRLGVFGFHLCRHHDGYLRSRVHIVSLDAHHSRRVFAAAANSEGVVQKNNIQAKVKIKTVGIQFSCAKRGVGLQCSCHVLPSRAPVTCCHHVLTSRLPFAVKVVGVYHCCSCPAPWRSALCLPVRPDTAAHISE